MCVYYELNGQTNIGVIASLDESYIVRGCIRLRDILLVCYESDKIVRSSRRPPTVDLWYNKLTEINAFNTSERCLPSLGKTTPEGERSNLNIPTITIVQINASPEKAGPFLLQSRIFVKNLG